MELGLEKTATGTLLLFTESGFDKIPATGASEHSTGMTAAGRSK